MEPGKKSCNIDLVSDDLSVTETLPLNRLLARNLGRTCPQTSNDPGKIARIPVSFPQYAYLGSLGAFKLAATVVSRLACYPCNSMSISIPAVQQFPALAIAPEKQASAAATGTSRGIRVSGIAEPV